MEFKRRFYWYRCYYIKCRNRAYFMGTSVLFRFYVLVTFNKWKRRFIRNFYCIYIIIFFLYYFVLYHFILLLSVFQLQSHYSFDLWSNHVYSILHNCIFSRALGVIFVSPSFQWLLLSDFSVKTESKTKSIRWSPISGKHA